MKLISTLLITTAMTFAAAAQAHEAPPLTYDTAPDGYSFDLSQNRGANVITFGQVGDSAAGSVPVVTSSSITNTE